MKPFILIAEAIALVWLFSGCGSTMSLQYGDGKQSLKVGVTLPERQGLAK